MYDMNLVESTYKTEEFHSINLPRPCVPLTSK